MLRKHFQILKTLLYAADISVAAVSWLFAYYARFYIVDMEGTIPPLEDYLRLLPVICVMWFAGYHFTGLYRSRRIYQTSADVAAVMKAGVLAALALLSVMFFYRGASYSRIVFAVFFVTNSVLMMAGRWFLKRALGRFRDLGFNRRSVLVIGAGPLGIRVMRKLEGTDWMGYDMLGFLDDSRPGGSDVMGRPVIGPLSALDSIMAELDIDDVYIALSFKETQKMPGLMKTLGRYTASVRIVPDIYQTITLNASTEDLDGIPVITMVESPLYGWGRLVKRAFDILFSMVSIVVLSPVMLLISAAVLLTSKGPVIFAQERMSLNGRKFLMYKFRSMRAAEDTGPEVLTGGAGTRVKSSRHDPRVTAVGRFLRKTSLDELPQFFNVLKGDMSIVGPRPERPLLVDKLKESVPGYMLKHKISSGITGWAQVNGWRGETSIKKRVAHDLFYIENWSLWFDIKIICLTIFRVLSDRNAY